MAPLDMLSFARALVDIDSTTGREAGAGNWLADQLRHLGYAVQEQPLERGCSNILATLDPPHVVFSTHFDCVPPFFPSAVRDGRLYGRGSCDAKGILAAQLAAAERLRASGERRVGLLFVAGEERGSDGAIAANELENVSSFLINGEPTDNRLALATRGILRIRLQAEGKAAHSAAPEHGVSAIDKLLDALVRLRSLALPKDKDMGATFYSIGTIEGGVAPNVISAQASAEILFRTVGDADELLSVVQGLEPLVRVEQVLRVSPIQMHAFPGFPTAVFPFTTDLPLLNRWGAPLLFGPGSFLVAHTDDEHVSLADLDQAVDAYERLAQVCLRSVDSRQ